MLRRFLLLCSCAVLSACQTSGMMPVPNLYGQTRENPFAGLAAERCKNPIPILYATDRAPETGKQGELTYGYRRSPSLAIGLAEVAFGEDVPWNVLEEQSMASERNISLTPAVRSYAELARYPVSGMYMEAAVGAPEKVAALDSAVATADGALHHAILQQMQGSQHHEVYLFVHGYNVSSDDAMQTIAQLWHFMGRDGLPIAYSWPAGRGGLRGYSVDRESGEFTVSHLKRFIEAVAKSPDVERIHLIAHSRGTDVTLTALRELYLKYTCNGGTLQDSLKIGDVILAAPDLDVDVANQRVASEGLLVAPDRLTVYVSEKDRAIGLATWLFQSAVRLGTMPLALLTAKEQERIGETPSLELIDARTHRMDLFGHSYFYQSPAVSSDVILILRHHAAPGSPQRPLDLVGPNQWAIHDYYPGAPTDTPKASRHVKRR